MRIFSQNHLPTNVTYLLTMRNFAILFILASLLVSCSKNESKPTTSCRFSAVTYGGSSVKKSVTYYHGDSVVKFGEGSQGYTLYFDQQKRLVRKEEPVVDPYYRWEMSYNAAGQISEERFYIRQSSAWEYSYALVFTYAGAQMMNIREEMPGAPAGYLYDHQLAWQGNDVAYVEHRVNKQTVCTTRFSYDEGKLNPMRDFAYFYFVDGDANYLYYKLPYYFSEHLITRQEDNCSSLSEPRQFTYTFTSSGLIESVTSIVGIGSGLLWEYEYTCR